MTAHPGDSPDDVTDHLVITDRAVQGGVVRILELNRPRSRNALNTALHRDLLLAFEAADHDGEVRAIVVAGRGPIFCAGGDIKEFDGAPDARDRLIERARLLTRLLAMVPALSKPVVASVAGAALGAGAALVLACDLIVAGNDMKLGFPEITGSMVPAVVTAQAMRHFGRKAAFEMLTQGRQVDAAEADRRGLVTCVVTPEKTLDAAVDVAAMWASTDGDTLRETKRLFYRVADMSLEAGLQAGLDVTAATWRPRR